MLSNTLKSDIIKSEKVVIIWHKENFQKEQKKNIK